MAGAGGWDFVIGTLAVEIQGWGRHQRFIGFEKDCEKSAHCLMAGYRPMAVTPSQVKTGAALEWVRTILGR